jgi:hypothetical protein
MFTFLRGEAKDVKRRRNEVRGKATLRAESRESISSKKTTEG